MKRNMLLLSGIVALMGLTSCAVEPMDGFESGDQYNYYGYTSNSSDNGMTDNSTFSYFVRVEKADGTNLFTAPDDYSSLLLSVPTESASICIIRERDQAQMTLDIDLINVMHADAMYGSLVPIAWNDMDLRSTKNRPYTYDDAYTTQLGVHCPGISEYHEVRTKVHVEGKKHRVTSCEVDGQVVTPEIITNGFPMFKVKVGE